jgi:cytoskeletal protein CcmA (bactofilin family)
MSNRETESGPPPAADLGTGWHAERARVAVGRNVTVSGRLIFQEPVRIEGTFKGEVQSSDLVVIAAEAKISEGRVKAHRLLVLGRVEGDVESERVFLGPASVVTGNISAAYLTICEGAEFNGAARMASAREMPAGSAAARNG